MLADDGAFTPVRSMVVSAVEDAAVAELVALAPQFALFVLTKKNCQFGGVERQRIRPSRIGERNEGRKSERKREKARESESKRESSTAG